MTSFIDGSSVPCSIFNELGIAPMRIMYQPRAKLEFVRRYCSPQEGWLVFVDIDPSEEGRTGGIRKSKGAREREMEMRRDALRVREELGRLGITPGGDRKEWFQRHGVPLVDGDRDIVAFHKATHRCLIAEIEAESSGQPEQKVYKAVGQVLVAGGVALSAPWTVARIIVVSGERMRVVLKKCRELHRLGISGLMLADDSAADAWIFGKVLETRLRTRS